MPNDSNPQLVDPREYVAGVAQRFQAIADWAGSQEEVDGEEVKRRLDAVLDELEVGEGGDDVDQGRSH